METTSLSVSMSGSRRRRAAPSAGVSPTHKVVNDAPGDPKRKGETIRAAAGRLTQRPSAPASWREVHRVVRPSSPRWREGMPHTCQKPPRGEAARCRGHPRPQPLRPRRCRASPRHQQRQSVCPPSQRSPRAVWRASRMGGREFHHDSTSGRGPGRRCSRNEGFATAFIRERR